MKNLFMLLILVVLVATGLGACKPEPKDITITFEDGECTYSGPSTITGGWVTVNWLVKDIDSGVLTIGVVTLTEGKTDTDLNLLLEQFENDPAAAQADLPSWLVVEWGWSGDTQGYPQQINLNIDTGPVYFVCYSAGAEIHASASAAVRVSSPKPLPTITPHAAPLVQGEPTPVIIDTDMAQDDWFAILYMLQNPDFDVLAILVDGDGEAHCDPGVQNALGLALLAGHFDIPVVCGRETPLQGDHVFPEGWRENVDNLTGIGLVLPGGINPGEGSNAVDLLTTLLSDPSTKITILTLGPLTNLAEAFESSPAIIGNIEQIYVMGGAVNVPGNVSDSGSNENMVAEYNIYIDPYAANVVFASGAPVTLVPLDATNYVPVTRDLYLQLQASQLTPEARFIFAVIDGRQELYLSGGYYLWDTLTAGILTQNDLATFEQLPICVVEEEGSQSGRTEEKDSCPMLQVAITADGERFIQMFLDTVNNP